jgi:hypothetical protein
MEQLAIKSFLFHGHPFHLYVYQATEGIPAGTIVQDANEILPATSIFKYSEHNSYAGFANFFRYKLLVDRGGWWVDMDVICLKPFRFPSEYVFSSERVAGRPCANNGIIKAPAGAPVVKHAWEACRAFDPRAMKWGQAGPALLSKCVEQFELTEFVQDPNVFCPIDPPDWESVLEPRARHEFPDETHAVHLWNELWRRMNRDKDGRYGRHSFYERLKRTHGVRTSRKPRPVAVLDDFYSKLIDRVRQP